MVEEGKTLKQYCKEAKMRLKKGFWQNYKQTLDSEIIRAEQAGIAVSKVKDYYNSRVSEGIKNTDNDDEFYLKVKKLLNEEGEVSNAIGRLTDLSYYRTLTYEEQQRYNLSLSERYLRAVERYRKEKSLNVK